MMIHQGQDLFFFVSVLYIQIKAYKFLIEALCSLLICHFEADTLAFHNQIRISASLTIGSEMAR